MCYNKKIIINTEAAHFGLWTLVELLELNYAGKCLKG